MIWTKQNLVFRESKQCMECCKVSLFLFISSLQSSRAKAQVLIITIINCFASELLETCDVNGNVLHCLSSHVRTKVPDWWFSSKEVHLENSLVHSDFPSIYASFLLSNVGTLSIIIPACHSYFAMKTERYLQKIHLYCLLLLFIIIYCYIIPSDYFTNEL